MTKSKRGVCIIINVMNFKRKGRECKNEQRVGSEIDVSRCRDTFQRLGFEVRITKDPLYRNQMLAPLRDLVNQQNDCYDREDADNLHDAVVVSAQHILVAPLATPAP